MLLVKFNLCHLGFIAIIIQNAANSNLFWDEKLLSAEICEFMCALLFLNMTKAQQSATIAAL